MSDKPSSMSPPMPHPQDVQQDYARAKQELEIAFKDFHQKHFSSKVLEENKSPATKKTEQAAIDRLVKSAVALESLNVGEGILALVIIIMRQQLSTRDRVNHLEFELCKAIRDIQNLKKDLGVDDGQPKKQ
jgi:hypothetical protein